MFGLLRENWGIFDYLTKQYSKPAHNVFEIILNLFQLRFIVEN